MGKQVPVAMLEEDEIEFLVFLRRSADVRVFRQSAPKPEALAVRDFSQEEFPCWQFFVWNTAFPWALEVATAAHDALAIERNGWSYISNAHAAPLLEYGRHNFSQNLGAGRIYWAKGFAAPDGLNYNAFEFERWYDSVARWVRKTGRRSPSERYGPYYMPQAWLAHGKAL